MLIRAATPADVPVLEQLIAASARTLSAGYYNEAQTDAAIANVFGVDRELIEDGTYLVAEEDGELAGCGGWSRRTTLFGSDRFAGRTSGYVDPATGPAKIRAFFVAPTFARRGVGKTLLDTCEAAARSAGFITLELMATLPGVPFYVAQGYEPGTQVSLVFGTVSVDFVPMCKRFQI